MGKICNVDGNGQCIFEISDPNNHYLVNVTDGDKLVLSRKFYDASIRYKMFVACEFIGYENRYFHTVHLIKIWKLGNPSTLLETFTQESLERVKLGEQFLLLESRFIEPMKMDFVSIENGESRNFFLKYSSYAYAGGLLFLNNNIVRQRDRSCVGS